MKKRIIIFRFQAILASKLMVNTHRIALNSSWQGLRLNELEVREMLWLVEHEFGLDLADDQVAKLHTLKDLAVLVYQGWQPLDEA
jgi:acyl carrier protein